MTNKPKLNQPDVEITTTTVYSDLATKITNPYIEPNDVGVTNIHIYIHNYALTEVKKEWEEKGFIFSYFRCDNTIKIYNNLVVILISYDNQSILISDVNSYARSCDIPFDLIPLISKTLKVWETANA